MTTIEGIKARANDFAEVDRRSLVAEEVVARDVRDTDCRPAQRVREQRVENLLDPRVADRRRRAKERDARDLAQANRGEHERRDPRERDDGAVGRRRLFRRDHQGKFVEALRHRRVYRAGLDRDHRDPLAPHPVAERLQIGIERGFRSGINRIAPPPPITCH